MTHDFKGAERKSLFYVQGEKLERAAAKTKVAEDEQMEEGQTSLAFEVLKGRKDAADFAEAMEEVNDVLDASQDLVLEKSDSLLLQPSLEARRDEDGYVEAPSEPFKDNESMDLIAAREQRKQIRKRLEELESRAENEGELSMKGTLHQPHENLPEDPSPTREDEAPLDDAQISKIPPDARWTKIYRRLVNPEALEIGKERFEVKYDFVIVLRLLTKKELSEVKKRIMKTTSGNDEDRDRDHDQDRNRYKYHQEDARKKDNTYQADTSSLSSIPHIPRATRRRSVGGPTGRTIFDDILPGSPYSSSLYQKYELYTINQDRGVLPPSPPTRNKHDEEEVEPPANLTRAFQHAIAVDSPDAKFDRQNSA
ncbi:hypothetical protein DID88_008325 [Monilinia fructigena]|uniref:DUF8035 domain-containing protein n=1 Tax=Monilinia fructigena TaxID=38457 RepID=A0A395J532_9HELO|nr:hypothetical protein DID88_008325 [Monilinia fructigena]